MMLNLMGVANRVVMVMRVVGEDVEGVPKRLEAAGERVVDVRPG